MSESKPANAKTILVTGSTDGIGLQTAFQLAKLGQRVILHGKSAEKAGRVRDQILAAVPAASLHLAHADFSDLSQVREMAQDLMRLPRLDVLVNNAGVYMKERKPSKDGFEMTLAVNYLAPVLLTRMLLPLLKKSSDPRVVTVSSITHQSGKIELDDMNGERRFDPYRAYADSKLADLLFAKELARREGWLSSNALHPGVIDTKLLHAGFSARGDSPEIGARTSVFLATSLEVAGVSGKYFVDCAEAPCSAQAADEILAGKLWRWTEEVLCPFLEG